MTDELARPAQASEDSEQTQAISRAPSDTTEVTAAERVVDLRPRRPRRNYTWLNRSSPPPAANRDERAQSSEEGQRPAPDPLAHLPPGERPGIVRVREVRRDYEYHYEYIYEEVLPSRAAQLPPAAPQPAQLPPAAPPVAQPAAPLAAQVPVIEPRYSERPVTAPVAAATAVQMATATAGPAFAAPELELRPSLASRAGFAAVIAMAVVLVGLATAFYFSMRSASHASSVAAKPTTVEAPTAAAPPPTPQPAAVATVPPSVASAATPDTAAPAPSAKPTKRKKGTPQH